ncbi:MAG TPA: 4-aminobutyrate--2-oxoglutarate transaminase [Acidimicrobiales bacterium]|nr:4-aminobutyrate--2-oxoglutarate transaminase [Acidimicrobiales bacterium]
MAEVPQRRSLVTEIPGPRSRELMERRRAAVPAGVGGTMPVFAAKASGGVVVDVDGNSFIDLGAGIAVLNVGSSAPLVAAAVAEQADAFTHTCFQVTPYEGYVALAEKLNSLVPGDLERRSFFLNSGAEAVENAVKVARSATGRQAVVAFDHAFHGRTLMGMSLTAKAAPYKRTFGPLAPEVYRLPYSYPYRCSAGASYEECGPACAEAAITAMDRQIGGDRIAALVIEPVLGEGGVIVPGDGFLQSLSQYCAEHGIVFVADEVQAGFARTGRWFASEHSGIVPDIVTTAKGLGGGMPIAGVTGRADLMDSVHPGGLGSTFGGNPVACAAALAAIEEVERGGLVEKAQRIGETFSEKLRPLLEECQPVGDVRVAGAMAAVEFVSDRGRKTPDPAAASRVLARCHEEGVIALKAGTFDNVVRILPPLVIGEDLLLEGLDVIEKAIRAV